jgi:hypothetical protein
LDRWAAALGSAYLHAMTTPGKAKGSDLYNFHVSKIIFSPPLIIPKKMTFGKDFCKLRRRGQFQEI